MGRELQVISDFYDLMQNLAGRVAKFPRSHRFTLGADIERRLQVILAALVRAKYAGAGDERRRLLGEVNVELEVLRFQLRLAHDLKALAHAGHGQVIGQIAGVGAQVGGWLKATRPAP